MARPREVHSISDGSTLTTLADILEWISTTCEINIPAENLSSSWGRYVNIRGTMEDVALLATAALYRMRFKPAEPRNVPILFSSLIEASFEAMDVDAPSGRATSPRGPADDDED